MHIFKNMRTNISTKKLKILDIPKKIVKKESVEKPVKKRKLTEKELYTLNVLNLNKKP